MITLTLTEILKYHEVTQVNKTTLETVLSSLSNNPWR